MIGKVQLACCVVSFVANLALLYPASAESDPDKDSRLRELVAESEKLATAKKSSAAIEKCDKVIAAFKAYYGKQPRKIYCGNSSAKFSAIYFRPRSKMRMPSCSRLRGPTPIS